MWTTAIKSYKKRGKKINYLVYKLDGKIVFKRRCLNNYYTRTRLVNPVIESKYITFDRINSFGNFIKKVKYPLCKR